MNLRFFYADCEMNIKLLLILTPLLSMTSCIAFAWVIGETFDRTRVCIYYTVDFYKLHSK